MPRRRTVLTSALSGPPVPDTDHVSRYCKPSTVGEDGSPLAVAFKPRPGEDHLSVNWLEYFGEPDLAVAVGQVRQVFEAKQYSLRPNGRFAALHVGSAKKAVADALARSIHGAHLPVDDDESHSGILGHSVDDLAVAVELGVLVGKDSVYPATMESA